jgi:translation initiation factor 2 subunit 2
MNYEQLLTKAYENVEVTEESERFEILKVKGHHEGIRTIVTNFSQIATCARRDSSHLIKYLSKELASQCEISGDRLILSRKLSSKDINDKIEKYFQKYVICTKCKKPDTELDYEGPRLFVRCLACGEKHEVHKI